MGDEIVQNGSSNGWKRHIVENGHMNGIEILTNGQIADGNKLYENGTENSIAEVSRSEIQEFYEGKNVFITGATGFVGKVLLERYLVSCPGIDTIYIMIRGKSGHTPSSRLSKLFDCPLFKHIDKKVLSKVYPIVGELGLSTMGMSTEDYDMLIDNVDVVVHCAANVRFDATLGELVRVNIRGTLDLLDLCKKMKRLISFVYVSTIYSNFNDNVIDEKVYEPGLDIGVALGLENVTAEDAEVLQMIMPKIMKAWPNLYSFTKCITENVIMERTNDLPACIIRPGLVMPTSYTHPVPGYIDNSNGPMIPLITVSIGLMRVSNFNNFVPTTMQPADYCGNAIIASSWATACERNEASVTIYNYVPPRRSGWCLEPLAMRCIAHARIEPSDTVCGYPSGIFIPNEQLFYFLAFFIYLIPGIFGDLLRVILGQKPRHLKSFRRLLKHNKLTKATVCKYNFIWRNTRKLQRSLTSVDRTLFKMDLDDYPIALNVPAIMKGIKQYILKESPESSEDTLKRLKSYKKQFYFAMNLAYAFGICFMVFLLEFIFTRFVNFIVSRFM